MISQGDQQRAQIFTLQDYDTESLVAMRESLARFTAHAYSNRSGIHTRPARLTLEELRAMYGSVSEFRLRDGRILQGFLIQVPDGHIVRTPDGSVVIRMADVESVVLLE